MDNLYGNTQMKQPKKLLLLKLQRELEKLVFSASADIS
jgi:hypothetical protein